MTDTLQTLLRLREAARKETLAALRKAENERDLQMAKLVEVRESVKTARAQVDPTDATDLTHYHGYRLRQEMAERREAARLAQKDRDLEGRRNAHVLRVRDELALSGLIDARAETEREEADRRENKQMDEIANRNKGESHDAA